MRPTSCYPVRPLANGQVNVDTPSPTAARQEQAPLNLPRPAWGGWALAALALPVARGARVLESPDAAPPACAAAVGDPPVMLLLAVGLGVVAGWTTCDRRFGWTVGLLTFGFYALTATAQLESCQWRLASRA